MITFLYFVDKPGEVHNRRPMDIIEPEVNIPERWG
jgi:hypothetical protein